MNTSLIKANEAFFASSAGVEKNNGGRPSLGFARCTPGMSRASRNGKQKGEQKEEKKIPFAFIRLPRKELNRL